MDTELQPIFLDDDLLLDWERPLEKGWYRLHPYETLNARTMFKRSLGMDTLDKQYGHFRVIASTAKYEADVILATGKISRRHTEHYANPEVHSLIFSGSFTLYQKGALPGTKDTGYDVVLQRKIWTSTDFKPFYQLNSGLEKFLFPGTEAENVQRIHSILHGYELQQKRKDSEQRRIEYQNRESSKLQGIREGLGKGGLF